MLFSSLLFVVDECHPLREYQCPGEPVMCIAVKDLCKDSSKNCGDDKDDVCSKDICKLLLKYVVYHFLKLFYSQMQTEFEPLPVPQLLHQGT